MTSNDNLFQRRIVSLGGRIMAKNTYIDVNVEPTLYPRIEQFVCKLGAVTKDQILRYFRIHHKDTVEWCLERLLRNPKINYSEREKKYFPRVPTVRTEAESKAMDKAIWILAEFGDTNVQDFMAVGFPQSLLIITTDNSVYDVTVMNSANIDVVKTVIPFYRKLNTPGKDAGEGSKYFEEMPDIINHIALVPSRDLSKKLLGSYFSCYCTLNPQTNTPEYHEFSPKV